jgi:hypothetical protein
VSHALLGGNDVVHITQGFYSAPNGPLGRYHVRAVLEGKQATFGTPAQAESYASPTTNTPGTAGDGSATLILPNGIVVDSGGYETTADFCLNGQSTGSCGGADSAVFTSDTPDDGAPVTLQQVGTVLWCTSSMAERQLLALGNTAIALYPDGGNVTPSNVLMNHRDPTSGTWSPLSSTVCGGGYTETKVFADNDTGFGLDDWSATVAGGTVHAVRRLSDGTFEHRIMDPTAFTWGPGAALVGPPPALGTLQDSGLFVAPYGDGLVLLALSNDHSSILYTAYGASAGTWSGWLPLTTTVTLPTYLAGYAPPVASVLTWQKPAIVWTQPVAGSSYGIFGLQLP